MKQVEFLLSLKLWANIVVVRRVVKTIVSAMVESSKR